MIDGSTASCMLHARVPRHAIQSQQALPYYAVSGAQKVSQAEAKGKSPSEVPTKPSQWQGTQVSALQTCCQIQGTSVSG